MKLWFQIHTQHCNVKYISYWLLENKKERKKERERKEEKRLPGDIEKQIPRLKAGLLGSESLEFCTLNMFPWGYQQALNFGVSSLKTTVGLGI